jgi:hypothetical protein
MPYYMDQNGNLVPLHQPTNPPPMTGLGDLVKRATDALRIPACAPCAERQARLNQLFPWR